VRSRLSIVLCTDISFFIYLSIQTELYPYRQGGRRFERRPHFLASSLSLRQMTHSPGSCNSHNDGSYKNLRTFAAQSRIRLHVPKRLLHVTSLKDPFQFYHCVPHKYEEASFFNQCMLLHLPGFPGLLSVLSYNFSTRIQPRFSHFPICFQIKRGRGFYP